MELESGVTERISRWNVRILAKNPCQHSLEIKYMQLHILPFGISLRLLCKESPLAYDRHHLMPCHPLV